MDILKIAQSLIGNLSPYNYNTPVLGPMRKLAAKTFGKPDYSPQSIALALGVHGAPEKTFNIHMPGRVLKNTSAADTVNWTKYLQASKTPHLVEEAKNMLNQFTKNQQGKFTGSKGINGN